MRNISFSIVNDVNHTLTNTTRVVSPGTTIGIALVSFALLVVLALGVQVVATTWRKSATSKLDDGPVVADNVLQPSDSEEDAQK